MRRVRYAGRQPLLSLRRKCTIPLRGERNENRLRRRDPRSNRTWKLFNSFPHKLFSAAARYHLSTLITTPDNNSRAWPAGRDYRRPRVQPRKYVSTESMRTSSAKENVRVSHVILSRSIRNMRRAIKSRATQINSVGGYHRTYDYAI